MGNVYLNLPVPVGNGVGAWVDVSGLSPEKLVSVDGGAFAGQLYLEASNDAQASAFPCNVGPFIGPTFAPQSFTEPLNFMRVRRAGTGTAPAGAPSVNIGGASVTSNVFAAMNVPAGDGAGTATDLTGGGDLAAFSVVGPFTGQLLIETSTDGVNYSPTLIFDNGGGKAQSVQGTLNSARVRRRGTIGGPAPLIAVGSGASGGGGGGGGGTITDVTSSDGWAAIGSPGGPTVDVTLGANAAALLNLQPSNNVAITGGTITGTNVTFPGLASGMVLSVAGVLATATNLTYNDTTIQLGLGIDTGLMAANAGFQAQANINNVYQGVVIGNANAGAGASAELRFIGNASHGTIDMYSSGAGGGFANGFQISLNTGAGNLYLSNNGGGDTVWTMGGANTEQMRLTNAGRLQVNHIDAQLTHNLTLNASVGDSTLFQYNGTTIFSIDPPGTPGFVTLGLGASMQQAPGAVAWTTTNGPPGTTGIAGYMAIKDTAGHAGYIPFLQ